MIKLRIKSKVRIPVIGSTLTGYVVSRHTKLGTITGYVEDGELWRGSIFEVELIRY